jgi:D-xylose 1-dehydrogenase (NADP+, D-xylono-1,5-lactone-forming)
MGVVAFGFLSTARINEPLLAAARASDLVDVLAVASRDPTRAEAYARTHSIERSYGGYDELLADPDIEAVYISLPNALHVNWSIRALEAGKHVLCEKPFTRRPEEAERAFDVAERQDRILMEAFMYRHHPQTMRIKELVEDGAIGELRTIRAAFSFDLLASRGADDVRLNAELDGGSLMDVGCYCVSGARLLAGEPVRASGEEVRARNGVDISFYGTLRFPGDVVAQFHSSLALPFKQELEVLGDEGSLLVEAPWRVDLGGDALLRRESGQEQIDVGEADAYRLELENLAAAIRGESEPLLGREDAVAQAAAIAALYRSAEGGEVTSRSVTPGSSSR